MTQLAASSSESIFDRLLEHILINYRWIFVCFFLLPFNAIYEVYFFVRNWITFRLNTAPLAHDSKVRNVQKQVRDWNDSGRKTKMCTARPGWLTMSFRQGKYKKTLHNVKVNLVDVLEIDTTKRTVRVEPLVTMGQLTAALNTLGWTIPVVPELDDLTVGGLIMGAGIETSSHIYGLFQHTCVAFELVTADGSLVKCTENQNSDLFYSVPWSHGTLGFLVAAEIRIIPSKPFVKMEYLPCYSTKEMVETFEKEVRNPENEFVEAIVYSLDAGVVMKAQFADKPPEHETVNAIGKFYKPWFFKHVESFLLERKQNKVEYIPLRHYYHRHTRSLFWELQDVIPFGNHPLFRWIAGWAVPPKVSFLKLTQPPAIKRLYERNHMIQDMLVPLSTFTESLQVFHRETKLYPLWICPFLLPSLPGLVHSNQNKDELYVDIGAYGNPTVPKYNPPETTRRLEGYVRSVHGFQMMYADTYMTREEFKEMFDYGLYERVRKQYQCGDAFPEIYDKLNKNVRY